MKQLLGIVCAAILAMAASCRTLLRAAPRKRKMGIRVTTAKCPGSGLVLGRDDLAPLESPRRHSAAKRVDVISGTPGHVARVMAGVGDRVAAGQVVAQLDAREQRLRLEEDETALRAAVNSLADSPGTLTNRTD